MAHSFPKVRPRPVHWLGLLILCLLPALALFVLRLNRNFRDSAVQELQRSLAALMYQSDQLVLDLDLELSYINQVLAEGLRHSDGGGAGSDIAAGATAFIPGTLSARWPGLLDAAYVAAQGADGWMVRLLSDPEAGGGEPATQVDGQDLRSAALLLDRLRARAPSGAPDTQTGIGMGSLVIRINPLELERRSFLLTVYDERALVSQVLPALADRYFGPESGFSGYELAVYRPDGSLAFRFGDTRPGPQTSAPSGLAAGPEYSGLPGPEQADFVRPLFRDPGVFDLAAFYTRIAANPQAPPGGLAGPDSGPETGPAGHDTVEQVYRARQSPDYVAQYRFFSRSSREIWQLAVSRSGDSLADHARKSVLVNTLGALAFLGLIYLAIVLLYFSQRKTMAMAERERAFFASVSHELKTPVAVIRSAGENMAKGIVSGNRVAEYGTVLSREALRLGDTVDRLLLLAGLQSGGQPPLEEPEALHSLVSSVLARHPALMDCAFYVVDSAGQARPLPPPLPEGAAAFLPLVRGTRALLEAAIDSILSNASNYGQAPYELHFGQFKRHGRSYAFVRCLDHGPGIPLGERHKLFEPFFRGQSARQTRTSGTGVGLYLARRIARLHGGNARLLSHSGGGTMVELSFRAYP